MVFSPKQKAYIYSEHNPMKDKELVEKRKETIKKKYPNWGWFNIGRKRPDLSERNRLNEQIVQKILNP